MKIRISSVQFHPTVGDIDGNLKKIALMVNRAAKAGSKLVVLPEICDIGYELKAIAGHARTFPNESTETLSDIARSNNVAIVAGLAEKKSEGLFNASVVFDATGKIVAKYYKTHLCPIPPLNEPTVFKYGPFISDVTDVAGLKLGLTICYDIRFPEVYRKLAVAGAQVIANPSAFPRMRVEQLEICVRARAIENQIFMVSSNFCGTVGGLELGGRSMVVDPNGGILAKANETDEEIVTADVDLDEIERSRKERPVFTQRRTELY